MSKIYYIIENFPAGAGHKISVVEAPTNQTALDFYKVETHRCALPPGIRAVEITERVTEIYRYDDPNYEG